jgi:hypothetical protein
MVIGDKISILRNQKTSTGGNRTTIAVGRRNQKDRWSGFLSQGSEIKRLAVKVYRSDRSQEKAGRYSQGIKLH